MGNRYRRTAQVLPVYTRPHVLLVEDDDTICELLQFHLSLAGIACTVAPGGSLALRLGQNQPFDLLILDLGLPEIDGLTLCQCFRREGPNPSSHLPRTRC